jgi:hypothetical protein
MKLDEKTLAIKETDMQFEETDIEKVKEYEDQWELTTGMGSILSSKVEGFTPEEGHICKFYGKGFGYAVRGIEINGVVHSYLTEDQQAQKHKDWCEQRKIEQLESYEKNKGQYEEDYNSLPPLLKKRMAYLYEKNPDDRFDWEGYELFIMTQATMLYNVLKTKEKVEEFKAAEFDTQKEMVPELDDGHSGNTFGSSCYYASCLAEGMDGFE